MYRIDSEGSVDGKFSNGSGNEENNQAGTALDAEWLNAVQEEICGVIESVDLDLTKGNDSQLLQAIDTKLGPLKKDIEAIKEALRG